MYSKFSLFYLLAWESKNYHVHLEIETILDQILTQSYSKTMKVVITKATTGLLATCAITLVLFSSCETKQNVLTPEEIADGWQLLFDGKTLNGWKDYNGTTLTQPWHVVDGCIQAKGDGSDASGYIVTDKP